MSLTEFQRFGESMFKWQSQPPVSPSERIEEVYNQAARSRAMQLSRGSLMIQRGYFATPAEWRRRREEHEECIEYIDRWLSEKGLSIS